MNLAQPYAPPAAASVMRVTRRASPRSRTG